MRKSFLILVLVAAGFLSTPTPAEQVIYLTNGSFLPILSHRIEGDMIYVDLADNASMAFPAELVEKIESTGIGAVTRHGNFRNRNKMVQVPQDAGGSAANRRPREDVVVENAAQGQEGNAGAEGEQKRSPGINKPLGSNSSFARNRLSTVVGSRGILDSQNAAAAEGTNNVKSAWPQTSTNSRNSRIRKGVGVQLDPPEPPPGQPATNQGDAGGKNPDQQQ